MGIIDDYYGGYENLIEHTDEDGNVDYDAAYEDQLEEAEAELPDQEDSDDQSNDE